VRAEPSALLELRKSHGQLASAQLYVGRTSPLKLSLRAGGKLQLSADATYENLAPELFGSPWLPAELKQAEICELLDRARQRIHAAFVRGEAVAQTGLMRRYGLFGRERDPLIALDCEFERLVKHGWTGEPLLRLAQAKLKTRLLAREPKLATPLAFVPVVAAPNVMLEWRPRRAVPGLRLWRLSDEGELLDERRLDDPVTGS
jgi:hypothetical protein